MRIMHLKPWLVVAILVAGVIGIGGWWVVRGEVGVEGREPDGSSGDLGIAVSNSRQALASENSATKNGPMGPLHRGFEFAQFEGRRWQGTVVDLPLIPVVAVPVAPPMPMVQLPAEIQLVGVLVGSTLETSSAFLKIATGPVETVRVGAGPKSRPDVVVTEITRDTITVRYQGQLFPLKLIAPANPVLRRAE